MTLFHKWNTLPFPPPSTQTCLTIAEKKEIGFNLNIEPTETFTKVKKLGLLKSDNQHDSK
jgi:hypothetical protein